MNKQAPKSLPIPEAKVEELISSLTAAGFIETRATKDESQKVVFREFRDHGYLRNEQTSMKRRDPELSSAPVVSIYLGKKPKAVASPAANEILTSLVADLAPDVA